LLPLHSAASAAVKRTQTRREDLAWMRLNAPEIQAGGASLVSDTGEAPVVLVDRVAREVGLGSALRGTQPSGTGVRVQLEAAPFDTMIAWIASLDQRYGLAIESITVDRAARPGLVNANITFAAPRR
jgi:type II secretory pathway component PulM